MFKINSSINCVNLIPKDVARKLKNQKIKTIISEKNVPVKPSQPTCDCTLTTCECDISNKPKKIECLNAKSCELDCSTDKCDRKKKRQTIVLNAEEPYLPPLVDTRKLKKEVNCLCVPKDPECSLSDNWSTEISGGFTASTGGEGVAYGENDRWVAVGTSGGGNSILYSEDNGVTWRMPASGSLFAVGFGVAYGGNDRWVAVGNGSGGDTGNTILYSEDNGVTWMFASGSFVNAGFGVAYGGNDRWVAVGQNVTSGDTILYSKDNGETWTAPTSGSLFTNNGLGVAYGGNDRWVAVGSGGDTILYSEDNGETWMPASGSLFTNIGYGVAYGGNDRWVAVGSGGNTILYSDNNGETWMASTSGSFAVEGFGVAYCEDGLWVAVGTDNSVPGITILYSENGKDWDTVTTNPISIENLGGGPYSSPAFGNGKLIIPGKFDGSSKSFLINDLDIIPGIDCSNKCVIPEYEKSLVISIQPENQKNESFVMSGFENSNSSNKALLYPRVSNTVITSEPMKSIDATNIERNVLPPPIVKNFGPGCIDGCTNITYQKYNGNLVERGMTMTQTYNQIQTQPLKSFNRISFGNKIN